MTLRSLVFVAVGGAAFASSCLAFPARAEPVVLAAHRAVYTLKLDSARSGDVTAATGNMAYEVTDACDGWAVRQRLQMALTNRDGQEIQMVSDYTTFESKDGLHLRFRMRQTTDTAVTSEVSGDADLPAIGEAGEVHYLVPEDKRMPLPAGTAFPMKHTEAIIAAAIAGQKFASIPLFDGTSADGPQNSSIVVLNWSPPSESRWPALAALSSGRVHVAFFDGKLGTQEPDYEVGMRYWSNGVADQLAMDFGDFVMNGAMTEFLPQKPNC